MTLPCPPNTSKMSSAEQKQKQMANKNQNLSTPKVGHAEDSERQKNAPRWFMGQYGDNNQNSEGKAIWRERLLQLRFH